MPEQTNYNKFMQVSLSPCHYGSSIKEWFYAPTGITVIDGKVQVRQMKLERIYRRGKLRCKTCGRRLDENGEHKLREWVERG